MESVTENTKFNFKHYIFSHPASTDDRVFRTALNDIDGSKLGIGLMSYDGKTNKTIDEREIAPKFAELIKVGRRRVNSIAIWAAPIPDFWWRLAREWKRAIAVESRRQGTANLLSNGTTPHTGGCQATCDAAAHQECDDGICICSEGYFEGLCEKKQKISSEKPNHIRLISS